MKPNTAIQLTTPIELSTLIDQVHTYDTFIKGVIDIDQSTIAMGGEWHADSEAVLYTTGSNSKDLWGFNIFFDDRDIEYQSMINIKLLYGYKKMIIEDQDIIDKMNIVINQYLL
jgi:Protein of unknown function (DUF5674)